MPDSFVAVNVLSVRSVNNVFTKPKAQPLAMPNVMMAKRIREAGSRASPTVLSVNNVPVNRSSPT